MGGDPLRNFYDDVVTTGVEGVAAVEETCPRTVNCFEGGETKENVMFLEVITDVGSVFECPDCEGCPQVKHSFKAVPLELVFKILG